MKINNLSNRHKIISKIKEKIVECMGENIFSAIAYGSTLCEDFYDHSDFDILIFLKDDSVKYLKKLKDIRKEFNKKNVRIDFNVHCIGEIPNMRKDCFWHNNRSLYFQEELNLYGEVLVGKNPFERKEFDEKDVQKEAVRVVNSLLYQSRKLLINRELSDLEKINLMKWCIYSVLYALFFKGITTKTKKEALEIFPKIYPLNNFRPIEFLDAKRNNKVSNKLIGKAYKFLSLLDSKLFEEYKEKWWNTEQK